MTTLGAVMLPQVPPERLRAVARTAEESGLERLWLWEDCFLAGGVASMATALESTEQLRIGIGVLPLPLRNIAVTAMEMAALQRLFPGRIDLGIGHGVQSWMAQAGARVTSPVTLFREYVTALRSLLNGDTVSVEGRYVQLDDVTLDWPPTSPLPLLAGVTGPRSLRLSGELADGTILTSRTSPEQVCNARKLIDEGRAAGERTDAHSVIVYLLAASGPGAHERVERERQRLGYDSISGTGVAGDAEAVAEAVQRFAEAGADSVVLQPAVDDPDPEAFVRFVGEDVRPLVSARPDRQGGP